MKLKDEQATRDLEAAVPPEDIEMAPHQYRGRFPSTISTLSDVGDIGEDHETLVGHDPDEPDSPSSTETVTQDQFYPQTSGAPLSSPNLLSPVQDTRFNGVSYNSSPKQFQSPTRAVSPRNPDALTTSTTPTAPEAPKKDEKENITWMSLPHKSQLTILTLARLSEPITSTSLQSYLYHQLAWFNPEDPAAVISTRAGFVLSAFPAAQAVTSVFWGRIADSPNFGRKTVLVVGLLGTAVGTAGYGLASTWQVAIFWRLFSGILNGNVGVLRTMISEIVQEKKYQSRAFLLLPMCFNIGTIIGPVIGGVLADPVRSYPSVFGPGSLFGGEDGVGWMKRWPYALPNFVSAVFLTAAALGVFLGLDETLETRRHKPDYGIRLRRAIASSFRRVFRRKTHQYSALSAAVPDTPSFGGPNDTEHGAVPPPKKTPRKIPPPKTPNVLPIRRMWTRNVLTTLISRFLLSLTVGTFGSLWFIFLSTPRSTEPPTSLPFFFNGGLGLPPSKVGAAMAILGTIGICLQLFLYPAVSSWLGTVKSFRLSLLLFPCVFAAIPFLSLLPSTTPAPAPMDGPVLWIVLAGLLAVHVLARTFALPASIILVNNCAPHPSVLGTIHGVAQSVGSSARFAGPVVGGAIFGAGENMGMIGLAWWILAAVGTVSFLVSGGVKEGDGHEILLDGEVKKADGEVVYVGSSSGAQLERRESRLLSGQVIEYMSERADRHANGHTEGGRSGEAR